MPKHNSAAKARRTNIINYIIQEIKILNFRIDPPLPEMNQPDEPYVFEISGDASTSETNNQLGIETTVEIYQDSDKAKLLCSIGTLIVYQLDDLKKILESPTSPDQTAPIKIDFLKLFAANAVTTTRGILFAKTVGTHLEKLYLPAVNMDEMFNPQVNVSNKK
jgi:hypothetical protein